MPKPSLRLGICTTCTECNDGRGWPTEQNRRYSTPSRAVGPKPKSGVPEGTPDLDSLWMSIPKNYPTSSRIACFTCAGAGAYLHGSITLLARPCDIERSSVV